MTEAPAYPPAAADDAPGGAGDDAIVQTLATRILHGECGRIVLTVQADTPAQTRMLARVCTAAIEAGVLRACGGRLQKY